MAKAGVDVANPRTGQRMVFLETGEKTGGELLRIDSYNPRPVLPLSRSMSTLFRRAAQRSSPDRCASACLPSYSPDLSSIVEAFSKIKNILRKVGACTHEALVEAMSGALCEVTPSEAAGWFDHCGYEVEVQYL